ncbi:MAG: MOSC domain-containing protein [Gammaproteobacteria bacterium]
MNIGRIKELWRYPVKAMMGERLDACRLTAAGLTGDRRWALRDEARQEIQSCKTRPQLLLCAARCRGEPVADAPAQVDITFPDGATLGSDAEEIHAKLSKLTGHSSTLQALRPPTDVDFYRRHKRDDHTWLRELEATFDREPGEPLPDFSQLPQVVVDFVAVPGTFFLVTPVHVVTTATLAHLQSENKQADWDVRRFRPNFVIETHPELTGLAEQDWIGKHLAIGEAIIDCTGATPRCGVITRAQRGLNFDKTLLRTVVNNANQSVGIYATVVTSGNVSVGDSVNLIG